MQIQADNKERKVNRIMRRDKAEYRETRRGMDQLTKTATGAATGTARHYRPPKAQAVVIHGDPTLQTRHDAMMI